jgi:hypothetical protein
MGIIMTNTIQNRISRRCKAVLMSIFLTSSPNSAESLEMICDTSELHALIRSLESSTKIDREIISRITGDDLTISSGDTRPRAYVAKNVYIAGIRTDNIEYRTPVYKNSVDGTSLIIITFPDKCIKKSEIMEFYSPLEITNVPHGRSLEEETSFSRAESWGRISFGFPEFSPDFLRTIVILINNEGMSGAD